MHSHDPTGEHSHTGPAVTTWLDLHQAAQQAESVMQALAKKQPANKAAFESNFAALWMIWEKQPLSEAVTRLDSVGIGVLVFDPCAGRPEQGDFLSVMQQNIRNMKKAWQE